MQYKDRKKLLQSFIAQQQGYFTAKQALRAGYSYRLQHYHKNSGHWTEIERGVFRLADYPLMADEDYVRWSLWTRDRNDIPQGVMSHDTALVLHDLGDVNPGKIHITVPPKFRKKSPGGCILYKEILKPEDVQEREGFKVTTPLKTVLDSAAGMLELNQLEQVIRDAFDRGLLRPAQFEHTGASFEVQKTIRKVLKIIKENPL